jgi:hypothetical protein
MTSQIRGIIPAVVIPLDASEQFANFRSELSRVGQVS